MPSTSTAFQDNSGRREKGKNLKGITWKESKAKKPEHFLISIALSEMQTAI